MAKKTKEQNDRREQEKVEEIGIGGRRGAREQGEMNEQV